MSCLQPAFITLSRAGACQQFSFIRLDLSSAAEFGPSGGFKADGRLWISISATRQDGILVLSCSTECRS